ncbi:hypothetical protein PENSPDRAFT_277272 [Peniophora sp. CONT]|nr:hypothetical protein PENSPDRAFT_277272 [Peniophora sp. CONT]
MSSLARRPQAACTPCRGRHVRCIWSTTPEYGIARCQRCRERDLDCVYELTSLTEGIQIGSPTVSVPGETRAVFSFTFPAPSTDPPIIIPFSTSESDPSPAFTSHTPIAEPGAESVRSSGGLNLMVFLTIMGVVAAFGFAAVTLALTGPGELSKHPILRTLAILSGAMGALLSVTSMIAVSLIPKASTSSEVRAIKRARCILLSAPSVVCDIVSVVCVVVAVQPWLSGTS